MLQSKKTILITGGLTALAILATSFFYFGLRRGDIANASPAPELLSEMPAGASSLVYADLAAIRASSFYQQRPDHGPIAVPDRDYGDFVQSTGFDFEKDLDSVAVASWSLHGLTAAANGAPGPDASSGKQDQKRMIVVADGRFDRKKIHDYALRKGKIDRQDGRDVFQFPIGSQQPGWNSITFLNDHRVAIVEGPSIAPLLAHHDGASAADPARERAARVAGAAVFAISRVPPNPAHFSPGGGASEQLMSLARSVQWITLAARPEGNNLRVSLEGECLTETDARQLQATLEVFRLFGRSVLESPKTSQSMNPQALGVLETILKTAEVSATGERVRILVEFTPDILKLGGPKKTQ